jgi:MraZ protein
MFRNHFRHTLDNKGRVSVPAEYRVELQAENDKPPFLTKADDCLRLYPAGYWAEYEARMIEETAFDPDGEDTLRSIMAWSSACPVDRVGRILIPQNLREHANLEREAVFVGMGHFVEIWNPARFLETDARTWARSRDLRRSLAARIHTKGLSKLGGPEGSSSSG